MKQNHKENLPLKNRVFWFILLSLFGAVMVITMLKDLWLTGERPNIWFSLFVPILSILGGVLCMFGAGKIFKQSVSFLTLLAISLGANTIMQVVENITKITYYKLWEYPGILYVILVIPLGFLLIVAGLMRWGKIKFWNALLFALVDMVGSIVVGSILTDVIGLTTPGS